MTRPARTLKYEEMASIKVKFRPSAVAGNTGTIYYQIIHERKVRQLVTGYKIYQSEWNRQRSMPALVCHNERKPFLGYVCERIRRDIERLVKIDRRLDDGLLPYTADDVIDEFNRYADKYSLSHYMGGIISKLKLNGKTRTSETYKSALNSISTFFESRASDAFYIENGDIMLDCISACTMESYAAWLAGRGVAPNTISFYTRILRAVYNRAVEEGVIENRFPFRHVYTGVDKTVKRALPLDAIRKIKELDVAHTPALDFARDMFLMSFYLRGMSFVDMAFLKKTDLRNGHVAYRRRKTGQLLNIGWTKEMQSILDKYPENRTCYLLPIIRKPGANERSAYRNAGYNINHNLKIIAEKLGLAIPLTLYVARHSWASAAKAQGVPLAVISEGMGHTSEATTQIYLASLDTSVVDTANSMILSSL